MIRLFYKIAYRVLVVYWFIFRPKTYGVKCIVLRDNQVLLIKNTYSEKDLWTLPGGGMKKRETSLEAVQREVKEETGLDIENLKKIGDYLNNGNYKKDFIYCFAATASSLETKIDPNEIEIAKWFDIKSLPENLSKTTQDIFDMSEAS